jgi:hypothetical protein
MKIRGATGFWPRVADSAAPWSCVKIPKCGVKVGQFEALGGLSFGLLAFPRLRERSES